MFSHTPFEHIPLVLEHSSMSATRKYAKYECRNRRPDTSGDGRSVCRTNLYSSVCPPTARARPDTRTCNCPACSCTCRRGKVRASVRTRRRLRHRKRARMSANRHSSQDDPAARLRRPVPLTEGGGERDFPAVFPVEGQRTGIAGTFWSRSPRSSQPLLTVDITKSRDFRSRVNSGQINANEDQLCSRAPGSGRGPRNYPKAEFRDDSKVVGRFWK